MNRKTIVGAVLVALAVMTTAGTLVASNMGFKLNFGLQRQAVGVSNSGTNVVALPDNRQTGLNTAKNLLDDIGLASCNNVQRHIRSNDSFLIYTGRVGAPATNNFSLQAGEAYIVSMRTNTDYIIVGSDDPAASYTFERQGVGVSNSGTNYYAFNYHQTAGTAKQLLDDIGLASCNNVQRHIRSADSFLIYTGRVGAPATNNFTLIPGEGYIISMRTTTTYSPSHY
jgi:hypothetical protein